MAADPEEAPAGSRPGPQIEDFLGEPTRSLRDWRWLWTGDEEFPIRSHRGVLGRLLVVVKGWLRPLVKVPQNDLWERQRIFNTILLDHLIQRRELEEERFARHDHRISHLEAFLQEGLNEVMRHNDALFARVDQKVDRYRREARDLLATLGGALAKLETERMSVGGVSVQGGGGPSEILGRALEEGDYLELERRYRGTESEIEERLAVYLPELAERQPVLDLGCGRGESLQVFGRQGIEARGVDGNGEMVAHCRKLGLEAEEGDLFQYLAAVEPESLGAVVSFHVAEHLPPTTLPRLVRLAHRALRPGGILILETPNPLSLVVAARSFWVDPTHQRPVHPETLKLLFDLAGFEDVRYLPLRPFPEAARLPEINLAELPEEQRRLADRINRLRDRLDETLFGDQDFAILGLRSGS